MAMLNKKGMARVDGLRLRSSRKGTMCFIALQFSMTESNERITITADLELVSYLLELKTGKS